MVLKKKLEIVEISGLLGGSRDENQEEGARGLLSGSLRSNTPSLIPLTSPRALKLHKSSYRFGHLYPVSCSVLSRW